MPRAKLIPDEDCVVRYCRGGTVRNGQPTRSSFMLRRKGEGISRDERALSVNWLQHFQGAALPQVFSKIKQVIRDDCMGKGRFVVFNAGVVKQLVRDNTHINIRIVYRPNCRNPSHAVIQGFDHSNHLAVATQIYQLVRSGPIYPVPD